MKTKASRELFYTKLKSIFDTFFTPFCLLLWLFLFAQQSGYLFMSKRDQGMVLALDDDAGMAVGTAVRTKWWNDNTFRPYGPVYYRITHTIARLISAPHVEKDQTPNQNTERNHHFALMFISLLSLHLICYIISGALFRITSLKILGSIFLVSGFVQSSDVVQFIFRAHPDWLFVLILLMALRYSFKLFHFPENQKYFYTSAFWWGTVFSTKMTAILFLPIHLFIWPFNPTSKEYYKRLIKYFSVMLGFYFLVGFPQNFTFWKVLAFLKGQSVFSQAVDLPFLQIWRNLFSEQFATPLMLVILLSLVPLNFGQEKSYSVHKSARFYSLLFIPLVWLLSQKILTSYHHYPFAFGTSILFATALLATSIKDKMGWIIPWKRRYLILFFILIFTVLHLWLPPVTKHFVTHYQATQHCKEGLQTLAKRINSHLSRGNHVLLDPSMPFNLKYDSLKDRSYNKTLGLIEAERTTLVGLTDSFIRRYTTPPSEYTKLDSNHWGETSKFYQLFAGKDELVDHFGNTWIRTVKDLCHRHIWEKKGTEISD